MTRRVDGDAWIIGLKILELEVAVGRDRRHIAGVRPAVRMDFVPPNVVATDGLRIAAARCVADVVAGPDTSADLTIMTIGCMQKRSANDKDVATRSR